eukprot:4881415-Prymnesium_polylepis.1
MVGEAIRRDGAGGGNAQAMLAAATSLMVLLDHHLRAVERGGTHADWPDGKGKNGKLRSSDADKTHRGIGMPAKAFAFFKAREKDGAWYRVAPPLATSFMKSTAVEFCSFVTEKKLPDPDVKGALLRKVKFEVELVEPPTAKGKQKKLSSLQQPRGPATVNFMDNNSLGEK